MKFMNYWFVLLFGLLAGCAGLPDGEVPKNLVGRVSPGKSFEIVSARSVLASALEMRMVSMPSRPVKIYLEDPAFGEKLRSSPFIRPVSKEDASYWFKSVVSDRDMTGLLTTPSGVKIWTKSIPLKKNSK